MLFLPFNLYITKMKGLSALYNNNNLYTDLGSILHCEEKFRHDGVAISPTVEALIRRAVNGQNGPRLCIECNNVWISPLARSHLSEVSKESPNNEPYIFVCRLL